MQNAGRLIAVVAALAVAAVLPGAAAAAPLPGTPAPVAPGVPGHGRVYELVTPADVMSAQLNKGLAFSDSGDRLAFLTFGAGALPGATEAPLLGHGFSVRGADGWTTSPVAKPEPLSTSWLSDEPVAFDRQLTSSIWRNQLPSSPSGSFGLFRQQLGGGNSLITDMGAGGDFVAASEDLNRVLFSTPAQLLAADAGRTSGNSIYQVTGSTLSLVNVDSSGALLSECGATTSHKGLPADGQRVFFASPDPSKPCPEPTRVYMRSGGTTTEISLSQCARVDCNAPADVDFLGATKDGSSAYLSSAQQLTDDDTNASRDLYRYDVSGGELTLLTPRASAAPVEVTGDPVLVSDDGSRVYFWAVGELVDDVGAEPEGRNLYLADSSGLHFVTRRVEDELQISRDGRYAIFATTDFHVNEDTDEVPDAYRYDAADRTYDWLSTGPTGGNAGIPAELRPAFLGETVRSHPYRVASGDGERVFFKTGERLLPADQNQRDDIYEWAGGKLGLVSPGTPGLQAWYLGTTPDGGSVLIATIATLLPRDRDGGELDFYVARVGGGFAEPTAPVECVGEACRGPVAPRLERKAPGTDSTPRQREGVRLVKIGPEAASQIVATGWLTVVAEVAAAGRFSARARAEIDDRRRTIAAAAVRAAEAGPVRLRMRLSRPARERLGRGVDLRVRLAARLGPTSGPNLAFTLRGVR